MWWARLATVATVGRRRGEAFQARGAIRRSRKAYNCCPGPGWPLWRHCWTRTGPAEARRSLSSPNCHPSLSESIELLSWAWLAWTKTGPVEARRGLSSPRCHPSLSESIAGPAEARRGFSSPRCHPSLSEAI